MQWQAIQNVNDPLSKNILTHIIFRWLGGLVDVGLVIERSRVQLPAVALSSNDSGQVSNLSLIHI